MFLGWGEFVGVERVEPLAEGCEVVGIGEDGLKLLGLGSFGKEVERPLAVGKGVSLIDWCGFVDYGGSFFGGRFRLGSGGLPGGLG